MELTGEQIKQALKCCGDCPGSDCDDCPCQTLGSNCEGVSLEALDYINNLEAESSRLQAQNRAMQIEINQLTRSINTALSNLSAINMSYEHLKGVLEAEKEKRKRVTDNLKAVLTERADHAEAINEFAERFLKKVHDNHYLLSDRNNSNGHGMFTVGIEQAVNETKEEMAGKTE